MDKFKKICSKSGAVRKRKPLLLRIQSNITGVRYFKTLGICKKFINVMYTVSIRMAPKLVSQITFISDNIVNL